MVGNPQRSPVPCASASPLRPTTAPKQSPHSSKNHAGSFQFILLPSNCRLATITTRMAQTPWGEIPVQDSHVHFFSYNFYSVLARQKKFAITEDLQPLLGWDFPPSDPALFAQTWLAELDKNGVERAALIAACTATNPALPPPSPTLPPASTATSCSIPPSPMPPAACPPPPPIPTFTPSASSPPCTHTLSLTPRRPAP